MNIYFDNAATSRFKPNCVISAALREMKCSSNSGRGTSAASIHGGMLVYDTREALTTYLGANSNYEVAFTSGCTEALNLAILGVNYGENANVITTCMEHNSVLRPLEYLCRHGRIRLNAIKPDSHGKINPNDIAEAINKDTALVIVNHISNVTGTCQDVFGIGEICRAKGVPLLVDGAQSFGHVDIRMLECFVDMIAIPAHKGINGIQGLGALVFNRKINLKPLKFGGTGTEGSSVSQPETAPEKYESGTMNLPAIAALKAAIEWHKQNDDKYRNKINSLCAELQDGLRTITGVSMYSRENNGVTAINISGMDSIAVGDILNDRGIMVRSGFHCAPLVHKYLGTDKQGAVRISCGFDNTPREVRLLLNEIERIACKNRRGDLSN